MTGFKSIGGQSHAVRLKQRSTYDEHSINQIVTIRSCYNFWCYSIILEYKRTNNKEAHIYIYIYTEVQVQRQNPNTNKKIEVITNNELYCISGNLFNFVLKHLQGDTQKTH